MKDILKKKIIGISGYNSFLAKSFSKKYKDKFIFKKYSKDINDHIEFDKWVKKNNNLNYFINFAGLIGSSSNKRNTKELFQTNFRSAIMLADIINSNRLNTFKYFLMLSTSHVFKKSNYKLIEKSIKQPKSGYGKSKLKLENKILTDSKKYFFKIGIARIFNYYNLKNKHNFINDIMKKLRDNNKMVEFNNVDTFRDFIHLEDIIDALYHMINLELKNDYNICSGKKIHLKEMILHLNSKLKNKKILFKGSKTQSLIGSNVKLNKTGWKCKKVFHYSQPLRNLI